MRIYLDVCCLNRPYDDQTQDSIRLESEAVRLVLGRLLAMDWKWVTSEAVEFEVDHMPNPSRRENVRRLMEAANVRIAVDAWIEQRQAAIQTLGFAPLDALHLSCAEAGSVDVFLSTDDQLVRLALRSMDRLEVRVENPLTWLREVVQ
jgi:hypothetical protein